MRNSITILIILIAVNLAPINSLHGQTSIEISEAVAQENKEEILKVFAALSGEELSQKKDEALRLAIENNNPQLVSWLIDGGAPLDVMDYNGQTVLHKAVKYQESLKILIETGVDLDMKTGVGYGQYTALMLAVQYPESLEMLIDAGAKVNLRSGYGYTALMEAVKAQNAESVQILIDVGANLGKKTKKRRETAMHYAEYKLEAAKTPEESALAEGIISILTTAGAKTSEVSEERTTKYGTMLALVLIAGLWIVSLHYIRRAFIAKKWPTVWGTIIYSSVSRTIGTDESRMYNVGVKYEYKVDGEEYVGSRIRFLRHIRTTNWKVLQKIADKYYKTREVLVYYNPKNPEMSVLEPGKLTTWMVFLFIYLAGSGFYAAMLISQLLK